MAEFSFMLQIIADYDEKTKKVTVKKAIPINYDENADSPIVHVIKDSEVKYGILTLGSKAAKQIGLPIGSDENSSLTIYVDNEKLDFERTLHKSVPGRIDGLTCLFSPEDNAKLKLGEKLEVKCEHNISSDGKMEIRLYLNHI